MGGNASAASSGVVRPLPNFHNPPLMMARGPQPGTMPPGIGMPRPQMVMPGQLPVMHKPIINMMAQSQPGGNSLPMRPQSLASDWTEHIAPDGRKYYYNAKLRESKWEKPVELMTNPMEAASFWKEYISPEGKKYYYNKMTKESRWTMPEEMKDAVASISINPPQSITPVQVVKLTETAAEAPAAAPVVKTEPVKSSKSSGKVPEKTTEEAKAEFKELLKSVGCATNWTWDTAMRAIVSDQRYGVLSSLAERKACFNEFIQECKNNRIKKEQQRERTAKEDFIQLIEETPEISSTTRYTKAKELIGNDPRWLTFDSLERERVFLKYLRDRYAREKQKRRKLVEEHKNDLREYLQKQSLKVTMTWKKISMALEGVEEFERLDRFDRLEVFSNFIQKLEKRSHQEKEKKANLRRRSERKNREAFKKLLARHREEGIINAKTRWKDYGLKLVKEPEYQAVATNKSGSRPRELFEDVLEEMEEIYEKDRGVMKEVYRKSDIVVAPSTTFNEFYEAMLKEDERMKDVIIQNIKIVYDELHYKAKEREAKETKIKKKALEEFKYCVKHSSEILETTAWEEAKAIVTQQMDLKVEYEADFEKLFSEYISRLRRKEEKRRKKESSESESDEHRHRSHKRKKRHISTDQPNDEIPYKKQHKSRRHHSESEEDDKLRQSKRLKNEKRREKEKRHKDNEVYQKKQRKLLKDQNISDVRESQEAVSEKSISRSEKEVGRQNSVEQEPKEEAEAKNNVDVEEGEAVREVSASEEGEL